MSASTVASRNRFIATVFILAAVTAGCGIFSVDEPGDTARITISGDSPGALQLILSNNFIQVYDPDLQEVTVSLLGSDTVDLADLPYNEDYGLDGHLRFFLRIINPDSAAADLRIQVRIENVEPYDITTTLRASQHEYTYTGF